MLPKVSVVIPAFNEEKTIDNIISRTQKTLEAIQLPYEIIVVDDGSVDKTVQQAYQHMCACACTARKRMYKATILTNGKNQGKGYALQRGFNHAKGDIIITIDADGSHNPVDIKKLLVPILNGADIVIGSRFTNGNGKDSTKKLHLFGNTIINRLIQIVTGKYVTDSQTGFRAFKKKIINQIKITSKGYQVETELTVKTLKNGNKVQEIPIVARKRQNGHSYLNPLRDGFKIFKTILIASVKS